jgi:hypothetical protein
MRLRKVALGLVMICLVFSFLVIPLTVSKAYAETGLNDVQLVGAVISSYVDNTFWSVASFEGGKVGSYHPVPWIFKKDYTVRAEGHWTGIWSPIGENRLSVTIVSTSTGETDTCELEFVSPKWFVAIKNNELYRLGHRI